MITDNLQEMVQPTRNVPFEYVDFDPNDGVPDKKNDLANPKPESVATGAITTGAAISPIKKPDILDSNYVPDSEDALIDFAKQLHNRIEVTSLISYWKIGRSISMFYKGKYGARELDKIADATGIGKDNLNKMIKFAGQYSIGQLKALIKGRFTISWNGIAQNLAIKPATLIEVYEKASDIRAFNRELIRCKNPDEKRGKSKTPEAKALDVAKPDQSKVAVSEITIAVIPDKATEKPIIVTSDIIQDEPIPAESNDVQKACTDHIDQGYEAYSKELEALKIENQRLSAEVIEINRQFRIALEMSDEDEKAIDERDVIIAAYRDRFKRLRDMIESNSSLADIMELLVDVE